MVSSIKHLGIIMDGNGRWAQQRGHSRFWGHLRGAQVAQKVIEECARQNLEVLTLYAFSTENWSRPQKEVSFLMNLLQRQLKKERNKLVDQNICFSIIGDLSRLPQFTQDEVFKTLEATKNNTGMKLIFALNYGARQEITQACKSIAELVKSGKIDLKNIDETLLRAHLETSMLPDPDLIIRTSGEYRLSNFLLWQAAYSEIFVSDTLWPNFTINELIHCFEQFRLRERRFGGTQGKVPQEKLNHLLI